MFYVEHLYWSWHETHCEVLTEFWKREIPKLSPIVSGFLIVSFFRKMESATFKKGQKRETRTAEAEETEVLLQSEQSQSGPLLKVFWNMFGTYFLLGTVCLVICDVFLFSIPKLLRYMQIRHVFPSHIQGCCVPELTQRCVRQRPQRCTHRHLNLLLLIERARLSVVLSPQSAQWGKKKPKLQSKPVHAFSIAVFHQWKGRAALSLLTTLLEQEWGIRWFYKSFAQVASHLLCS